VTPAVARLFSFLLVACFDSSFSRWAQPYHGAGAAHHDTYNSALPVLAATSWVLVPVFTAMSCSANKSEIQLSRIGVGLKCAPRGTLLYFRAAKASCAFTANRTTRVRDRLCC
jgi:hypothetical protein